MITTAAKPGATVILGYAGENEARQVVFEYPATWVEEFPNGTIALHVKRSGDGAVYQAQNITDDRESRRVTWTITTAETSYSGRGEVQLCLIDGGAVVKSQRYFTSVSESTATVTPTDPPPDTLIAQAVDNYIAEHVDVVTVSTHGDDGQILQSNGDGSYSWLTVTDPIIDSDTGNTFVPTRALNRLANAIRSKTHYDGDLDINTMAQVMEQTDLWTTEDFCLGIAPAAEELTLNFGAVPAYALYQRQNIAKVNLPYAGRLNNYAFANSAVSQVNAPNLACLTTYAFSGDTALVEADFPKLITTEGGYNFNGCTGLTTVNLPKLKYIYTNTFSGCYSLAELNLPELVNVTGLGTAVDSVFANCRAIERIELPKFEGTIRTSWFDGCYNLREAILPKLAAMTTNYNFRYCYRLTKVYAPECKNWGTQTFTGCTDLKRICLYTKPTTLSSTALNAPNLEDIYVPWSQGEVSGAPWGAPAGCTVHYNTQYDEDGEPIV